MLSQQDQLYKVNHESRVLYGQAHNANSKDMHDPGLTINVTYTQYYEVLEECGNEINFKLTTDEEDEWDIWWIDGAILPTLLIRMKPH